MLVLPPDNYLRQTGDWIRLRRSGIRTSFFVLLLLGLTIRIPALFMPINEGHRNAQTAALTAGMIENGSLCLDPIAPWRGDLEARLVQELPIYNLAVLLIQALPGINFDLAGRLASLIFWALSFIALQALWRRTLPSNARFWANLLFIVSPMNWYLSTAFMPESLLQLLAIGFMVSFLEYSRRATFLAYAGVFTTSLLGLLVKVPGFAHLGLFAAFVLLDRGGLRAVLRPSLLAAVLVMVAALAGWGEYVKSVNAPYFADWSGWANVVGFIRPEASRLTLSYYLPLIGYNAAFIVTIAGVPFILWGTLYFLQTFRSSFVSRVWIYLLASLVASWLLWGKGAPAQNYYNLPNLVYECAAFGRGVLLCVNTLRRRGWRRTHIYSLLGSLTAVLFLLGIAGYLYLIRHDRVTLNVAQWLKKNTDASDLIIYQPRHSLSVIDYQHQPLLSYLSGRKTWIWTRNTPDYEKARALATSSYAVVTKPPASLGTLEIIRRKFKGKPAEAPEEFYKTESNSFTNVFENQSFVVLCSSNVLSRKSNLE